MKELAFVLLTFMTFTDILAQQKELIYVGTYSVRGSEGIYVYEFDRKNAKFNLIQTVPGLSSPSFLAIHPTQKFLYSVNRGTVGENNKAGSASAYAIDASTGKLAHINDVSSHDDGPCHISIDNTGQCAFLSHYNGGSIVVLPVLGDGSLGAFSDSSKHTGRSVNEERQQKPYVHSAIPSPDNKFVYVSDLGTDKVFIYEVDVAKGKIKPAAVPSVSVHPGGGPRHLVFHPNGKYAYLAEEITSRVCVFERDQNTGTLTVLQDNIQSLPSDFTGYNKSAEICVDPAGRFLYLSNRGHDALAIFSIEASGKIKLIGQQETKGKTPRNFIIDPKGEFVFVAHQDSDNITIFKRDPKSGKLTDTGNEVKVPSPVCIKMLTSR